MKWIRFEQTKPENTGWYLIYQRKIGEYQYQEIIALWNGNRFEPFDGKPIGDVSHWMYLPGPPCTVCNKVNTSYRTFLGDEYKEFAGYELCPRCKQKLNTFLRKDPNFDKHLYELFKKWLVTKR
jgi:hypothetical protein